MENEQEKTTSGEIVAKPTDNQIVQQQNTAVNNVGNIDAWIEKRKEFLNKVAASMVEGKDFHIIKGNKSLAKGGAEKIASIFGWVAKFVKDEDTHSMLGGMKGLVCYMCYLVQPGLGTTTHTIGQGRGAAELGKNNNDPNKTIKMAQKSAYIDAVIRASGLSDIFTQDLEDMQEFKQPVQTTTMKQPNPPPIPAATNPEKRMRAVFEVSIKGCKTKSDLLSVANQIEASKKRGELSESDVSMLRGLFRGKDAEIKQ